MKKVLVILIVFLSLVTGPTATEENTKQVALPNSKLLRCKSSDCVLWPEESERRNLAYPKQIVLDLDQDCVYGMTILYDKSIAIEAVKEAIDARYGKWAVNPPKKLWRVEAEKFALQLSEADEKDERAHIADRGTKQVIYLVFGGRSACSATPS